MTIQTEKNGNVLTVIVDGSIDTVTAPTLEKELESLYEGAEEMIIDMAKVDYVSSAGLRVILGADRQMNDHGKLILRNVIEDVKEVFEMTGFDEILTIE
ncbi:MAG: STAS domain-containing protein [Bacteroidales bacterium]|nr:STAS domain-containing protein [Bacteroidales bacterium]